eukprot:59369-Chlamydomonas_euryale.AAC.3
MSYSTFFSVFLPTRATRHASFSTSTGGSLVRRTLKLRRGPISSSATRGMRVPLFLSLIVYCRKRTADSESAVAVTTRSKPASWLVDWPVGWLVRSSVEWLIGQLAGCFAGRFVLWFAIRLAG